MCGVHGQGVGYQGACMHAGDIHTSGVCKPWGMGGGGMCDQTMGHAMQGTCMAKWGICVAGEHVWQGGHA